MHGPRPNEAFPLPNYDRLCFLKNIVSHPNILVGGNPARLIRKRFDEAMIERILEMKWWDWPPEEIGKNLGKLTSPVLDFFDRKN